MNKKTNQEKIMGKRKQKHPMLHGNGSGYAKTESCGNVKSRFLKKLGSEYILEAYIHIYINIIIFNNFSFS